MLHLHPLPIFLLVVNVWELELLRDLAAADESPHDLGQQERVEIQVCQKSFELLQIGKVVLKKTPVDLFQFAVFLGNLAQPGVDCQVDIKGAKHLHVDHLLLKVGELFYHLVSVFSLNKPPDFPVDAVGHNCSPKMTAFVRSSKAEDIFALKHLGHRCQGRGHVVVVDDVHLGLFHELGDLCWNPLTSRIRELDGVKQICHKVSLCW